ncbi:MAG: hypothetical protein ABI859_16750 [Pseudomonadota bacterium]
MKGKFARYGWGGLVVVLAAGAQSAGSAPMKDPLYGDPGHPNLSGMWNPEYAYFGPPLGPPPAARPPGPPAGGPPGAGAFPPGPPPGPQLTPPYAKRFAEWKKKFDTDGSQEPDTVTRCLAFGMPRFGTMPVEIIQTPGQITMNLGVLHDIRRIYLDGIGHTTGADPSFSGDSVGRWEGDTLIVETNNLRAATVDRNGMPFSDKLTAVEKIRRVSPTRLEIETTMTDPEAFLAPFTMKRAYVPMPPGSRFEEYICENNKEL